MNVKMFILFLIGNVVGSLIFNIIKYVIKNKKLWKKKKI